MAQYQQWLYYQEADRRLRAELESLEIELAHIQERLRTLEPTLPPADNIIIRALAISLPGHTTPSNAPPEHPPVTPSPSISSDTAQASSSETISPALYNWGRLPNFDQEDMQEPLSDARESIPLTPHPEMALLPEDMAAFFDAHDQTEPQLELPWWLSKIAASANNPHGAHPIDNQSIRTNHLVQRWRQRWGRPVSIEQPFEKSEDTSHE